MTSLRSFTFQVKIWFQNRRMKWRNSKERELIAQGGCREQTLPTKHNPNPDLSDPAGTAAAAAAAATAAATATTTASQGEEYNSELQFFKTLKSSTLFISPSDLLSPPPPTGSSPPSVVPFHLHPHHQPLIFAHHHHQVNPVKQQQHPLWPSEATVAAADRMKLVKSRSS